VSDTITDSKGRKIEVQEVVGRNFSRVARICGSAFGDNLWSGGTMARLSVRSIDGKPMPPLPTTLDGVDDVWDMVDAEAAAAALGWLAARQAQVMADAGNSQGHPESESVSG
jgi:hypothetical protein